MDYRQLGQSGLKVSTLCLGTMTFGAETSLATATKIVNSFEGGAVVTDDGELADELRLVGNFGYVGYDEVSTIGTNAKLCEPNAALGLTSIESIEDFIEINRAHHETYRRQLATIDGVTLLEPPPEVRANFHYVVVRIEPATFGLTRDELYTFLHLENVLARR
ncbi:MAG: DegT/DnrJ/EryC1/StrS family aminotransferase, partial [Pseudomonadota bacterium]